MRILQAIHDFLPDHRAGSEIYTYHLSQALAARGHDVSLLFTEKRPEREQFSVAAGSYEGLPFHEIVYNRHFHDIADLYDDPRMEAPIGAVLDRVIPDVLHIQSLVYLGLSLVRAARARRIPMVMTLHEYFLTCARGGLRLDLDGNLCDPIDFAHCARCLAPYPMDRARYPDALDGGDRDLSLGELRYFARAARVRLERLIAEVAPIARFIAPSHYLGQRLIAAGLPAEKVVVSDYGFPPLPPGDGTDPKTPPAPRPVGGPLRLGYLGTLSDYKGIDVAVDAFAKLPQGACTLRVKGDPTWFPDFTGPLMQRAALLPGLDFEGPLPAGEFPRFLAEVDLLVVPSMWWENSPLTIHEAFQCGVPVVTTDLGGMRELIGAGGGVAFRRGDPSDLARVILEFVRDPARLERVRGSIPAVKPIDQDASEIEALLRGVSRE